jgi:hypothetical protein
MQARRDTLVAWRPGFDAAIADLGVTRAAPPQVALELGLEARIADAQVAWLEEIIAGVNAGDLVFADDTNAVAWQPPPDDPGWRMMAERQRYLARLGANG